jgi:hypothetical protein
VKVLWQYAHDRVGPPAQHDRLPDGGAIAVKAPLPQRVADDRDRRRSGAILGWFEAAPEHWLHAEHVEDA